MSKDVEDIYYQKKQEYINNTNTMLLLNFVRSMKSDVHYKMYATCASAN